METKRFKNIIDRHYKVMLGEMDKELHDTFELELAKCFAWFHKRWPHRSQYLIFDHGMGSFDWRYDEPVRPRRLVWLQHIEPEHQRLVEHHRGVRALLPLWEFLRACEETRDSLMGRGYAYIPTGPWTVHDFTNNPKYAELFQFN